MILYKPKLELWRDDTRKKILTHSGAGVDVAMS